VTTGCHFCLEGRFDGVPFGRGRSYNSANRIVTGINNCLLAEKTTGAFMKNQWSWDTIDFVCGMAGGGGYSINSGNDGFI
jgi:hypothetical protein